MSSDYSVITLNKANNASYNTDLNRLVLELPLPMVINNQEVAFSSGVIFNSIVNVNAAVYGNSTYTVAYPTTAGHQVLNINMPDGYYSVDNLSNYLQSIMAINKLYLLDNTGAFVYYMAFVENPVSYGVSLTATVVPNTLPTGYTLPAGSPGLPATAQTPQLTVLSSPAGFGTLIGYAPGNYPPTTPFTSDYSTNSTFVPTIDPQYSFNITTNLVNLPRINTIPNSIYEFTFTVDSGGQEQLKPYNQQWYSISDGFYNQITVNVTDQSNRPALIRDNAMRFTLVLRNKLPH